MPQFPGTLYPMVVGPILEELAKSTLLAGVVQFSDLNFASREIAVDVVNAQLDEMKRHELIGAVPARLVTAGQISFKDAKSEIYAAITFAGYEYLAQYRSLFPK